MCRFGCHVHSYGICPMFKRLKISSLSLEDNNAKQGGGDGWTERGTETYDLVSVVCVLMFLSSHAAALCCTCTQLTGDTHPHTHTHHTRMWRHTNRHTQAHKELCATGGVGVIVSYRWWQQGHMLIYFWGFFGAAIRGQPMKSLHIVHTLLKALCFFTNVLGK